MTQQQIDTQNALMQTIERDTKQLEERLKGLKVKKGQAEHSFMQLCDHKYPDGSNACKGYFAFSQCELCGIADI